MPATTFLSLFLFFFTRVAILLTLTFHRRFRLGPRSTQRRVWSLENANRKSLFCLSAAFFVSSAFCLAAMMTVLGFAVVQYFSICHPLQNMTVVSTSKVGPLRRRFVHLHCSGAFTLEPGVGHNPHPPPGAQAPKS